MLAVLLTWIWSSVSPFTTSSTGMEAPAHPLLATAGMDNLEPRRRALLTANMVGETRGKHQRLSRWMSVRPRQSCSSAQSKKQLSLGCYCQLHAASSAVCVPTHHRRLLDWGDFGPPRSYDTATTIDTYMNVYGHNKGEIMSNPTREPTHFYQFNKKKIQAGN